MKLVPSPSSSGLETCACAAGTSVAAVRSSVRADRVMRFMISVSLTEVGVYLATARFDVRRLLQWF